MSTPKHLVLRNVPGGPDLLGDWDGRWIDATEGLPDMPALGWMDGDTIILVKTDRFETDVDGAVGQVYEARP